jgi:nitronate monooxygenase
MTRSLTDLLRCPIVVAPIAGGPSTAGLVIAAARAGALGFLAARAGALGFLAAGYKTAEAMAAEIAAVRAATAQPFGVNVFVPGAPCADAAELRRYLDSLSADGILGDASWDDDRFDAKIAALLADPPSVTSFTFGCPPAEVITALQGEGSVVVVTVTSPDEAAAAAAAGADAVCVQGFEAGAHRGTFVNDDAPGRDLGLLSLIGEVAAVTGLPQIAAGGIMGPRQVNAALAAGSGGRAVRHGVPALPGKRGAPAAQGRAGRPALHCDHPDQGVQRAPGPRAGQQVHPRPSRRAGRVPGDQ